MGPQFLMRSWCVLQNPLRCHPKLGNDWIVSLTWARPCSIGDTFQPFCIWDFPRDLNLACPIWPWPVFCGPRGLLFLSLFTIQEHLKSWPHPNFNWHWPLLSRTSPKWRCLFSRSAIWCWNITSWSFVPRPSIYHPIKLDNSMRNIEANSFIIDSWPSCRVDRLMSIFWPKPMPFKIGEPWWVLPKCSRRGLSNLKPFVDNLGSQIPEIALMDRIRMKRRGERLASSFPSLIWIIFWRWMSPNIDKVLCRLIPWLVSMFLKVFSCIFSLSFFVCGIKKMLY